MRQNDYYRLHNIAHCQKQVHVHHLTVFDKGFKNMASVSGGLARPRPKLCSWTPLGELYLMMCHYFTSCIRRVHYPI